MTLMPKVVNFEEAWPIIRGILHSSLIGERLTKDQWQRGFSTVYEICIAKPEPLCPELYLAVKKFLNQHTSDLLTEISNAEGENILEVYCLHWNRYSKGTECLSQFFRYLNTQYVKRKKGKAMELAPIASQPADEVLEVGELAFDVWKRKVVSNLKSILVRTLLDEIHKDRVGTGTASPHVRPITHSLTMMDGEEKRRRTTLYEKVFESAYLGMTKCYFRRLSTELMQQLDPSDYMVKALALLDEERLRSRKFVHESSWAKIHYQCLVCLVEEHLTVLHASGADFLRNEQSDALKNMYALLQPVKNGLKPLSEVFDGHVKKIGNERVHDFRRDPVRFVEVILEFHSRFRQVISDDFSDDQLFLGALDRACESIVNQTIKDGDRVIASKAPEMVAKYTDLLLRKNRAQLAPEEEVEKKLEDVITVFRYLDDKDIFQKAYSHFLTKRLIYSQSASKDAEEAMITRLKRTCGNDYTCKMQRMMNDIAVSEDLNNEFQKRPDAPDITFYVNVLCAGSWPITTAKAPSNANIPEEILNCILKFEAFYITDKFNGRKLSWAYGYGSCELKLTHLPQPYLVTMSVYQAAILMAFNDKDALPVEELSTVTHLDWTNLCRELTALVECKLLKSTVELTGDTVPDGMLTLNMAYRNKRMKFKVTASQQKEAPQEMQKVHKTAMEDRKVELQAAIVRVMKDRKRASHVQLMQLVIEIVSKRFHPKVTLVKQMVELLIEKGYIERDPISKDTYLYIA